MRPEFRLLDARSAGLDDPGLRRWARTLSCAAGARHGSRSYRHPYALVAWHEQPVGVDIERIEPAGAEFAGSICTPAEEERLAGGDAALVTSLWCAKEALAKALGDARAYDPRRLESPLLWTDGKAGPWRAVELTVAPGHVAWLCWRCAQRTLS